MTVGTTWVAWPFHLTILVGVGLVAGGYLYVVGKGRGRFADSSPVTTGHKIGFLGGLATILLVLQTPLDGLSDDYLFSAHMVQHLLISLVAPPLLLYGTPAWLVRPLVSRRPVLLAALRGLTAPLVAFITFNAVFVVYHLPVVYEAALNSESLHVFVHMLLIVTGLLNWWPVLGVLPEAPRLLPPLQMLYLFVEILPQQILGVVFTYASSPFYARYVDAPRLWPEVTAITDQQIGGLIMWVGGSTFYLFMFALIFLRWAAESEASDRRGATSS